MSVSRTDRRGQSRAWDLRYTFDAYKLAVNVQKHRVWFEEVRDFEWEQAWVTVDQRKRYSETRFRALGYIRRRIYVLVFCLRCNSIRLISLRKANFREIQQYAQVKAGHPFSNC